MKYAGISGLVRWSGGSTLLSAGITTADDDHPLVVERPDLWTEDVPAAHLAGPGRNKPAASAEPAEPGPVERATRAPGERRQAIKRTPKASE